MSRDLCIMACVFCKDEQFWRWLKSLGLGQVGSTAPNGAFNEDGAKRFILDACHVKSRNELDTDTMAAKRFHAHIREPFLDWKESQ